MYKYLLFDADNTLFDFNAGERQALIQTLASSPLDYSDEVYKKYHDINDEEWKKLELGLTTRERLRCERFSRLFDAYGFENTERLGEATADVYVKMLAEQGQLFDGAVDILKDLSLKYKLYIVTNGLYNVQRSRFAKTDLPKYITKLYISEELGVSKPDKRFFDAVVSDIGASDRSKYLVIGDSLSSDIKGAKNAGIDSCYFNSDGYSSNELFPTYTIKSLYELKSFL